MAVNVVNEYAAISDRVFVILVRRVDFPTEGKPTRDTRASPLLLTSKPDPPPEPDPGVGSSSCARRRASFLARSNQDDSAGAFFVELSIEKDKIPF